MDISSFFGIKTKIDKYKLMFCDCLYRGLFVLKKNNKNKWPSLFCTILQF